MEHRNIRGYCNNIATVNYKKLNDILSSSIIFKVYDFNVTSASIARSRDVNYFYT